MDAVEGKECTAEGDGLTGFTAQQVPTSFTIVAAGSGGARLTTGGGSFKVSVRGQVSKWLVVLALFIPCTRTPPPSFAVAGGCQRADC